VVVAIAVTVAVAERLEALQWLWLFNPMGYSLQGVVKQIHVPCIFFCKTHHQPAKGLNSTQLRTDQPHEWLHKFQKL
jgi:hypothetical protein